MLDAFKSLPGWLKLWIVFPLGFLNGWLLLRLFDYLQPFLNILIAAAILAFLLDLPAIFLQQRGIPKGVAIAAVVSTAMLLLDRLGELRCADHHRSVEGVDQQPAPTIGVWPTAITEVPSVCDRPKLADQHH